MEIIIKTGKTGFILLQRKKDMDLKIHTIKPVRFNYVYV